MMIDEKVEIRGETNGKRDERDPFDIYYTSYMMQKASLYLGSFVMF